MRQKRAKSRSPRRRCVRFSIGCLSVLFAPLVLYLAIALVGLVPVNNDFKPTPDGIEVAIVSDAIHADIVLPIATETIDWRKEFPADRFRGNTQSATRVAIGWGDRGFFIETPTLADLRVSTAAKALFWPSASCLHVSLIGAESLPAGARSVKISIAQYERLVAYINESFRHDGDGSKIQIRGAAHGTRDAFFEARGTYTCLNTCNTWIGRAMRSAGMQVGWLTPLPKTMLLYLPDVDVVGADE